MNLDESLTKEKVQESLAKILLQPLNVFDVQSITSINATTFVVVKIFDIRKHQSKELLNELMRLAFEKNSVLLKYSLDIAYIEVISLGKKFLICYLFR